MTKADLIELVRNGENSGVEFKRDDVQPEKLAHEMVALLNLNGGQILLGVEDDRSITGLVRDPQEAEQRVMQVARDRIRPSIIPYWETISWDNDAVVGIISLPSNAPDRPYKAKSGSRWITRIRAGTIVRDATREEEARLYQRSGQIRYGQRPVLGHSLRDLDLRRLSDYFNRIQGNVGSLGTEETETWERLLINTELAVQEANRVIPTIDGVILFGQNPRIAMPQSGVRAICYPGKETDYTTRADEKLWGALVPLGTENDPRLELGLVDKAWDFVRRNTERSSVRHGARRLDSWDYPEDVVREALVNALIHRDYSITGTDVEIAIYSDRMEVISPGDLPNTVTPEKMRAGFRYARNQTLVYVMRDYGYVENRGMGISRKIIPGMLKHNGTEPDLIPGEHRFTVRLWKKAPGNSET